MRLATILFFATLLTLSATSATQAAVVDDTVQSTDGVIISEIYQSDHGSFIEFYNNSDHDAYGWRQFFLNPHTFGIDLPNLNLPPLFDLRSIKPHGTKSVSVQPIWVWVAINYFELMSNDALTEVQDALDERPGYSYQRCLTRDTNGQPFISDKFYYAKATRGAQLDCASLSLTDQTIYNQLNQCHDIKLNEVYSNAAPDQQFIEVQNTGTTPVDLSTCYLSTDHLTSPQPLGWAVLLPHELYAVGFPYQTTDPNWHALGMTGGQVKLLTTNQHAIVDELTYHGQQPNHSYSLDDNYQWQFTLPTPNAPNQFQITKPITHPISKALEELATDQSDTDNSTTAKADHNQFDQLNDQLAELDKLDKLTKQLTDNQPDAPAKPATLNKSTAPEPDIWPAKAFAPPLTTKAPAVKVKTTPARNLLATRSSRQNSLKPKVAKAVKSSTKPAKTCPEGSQLNPATNRCAKSSKLDHQPAANKSDASSTTPPATSDYSPYIIGAGLGTITLIVLAYQILQARHQVKLRRSAQVLSPATGKLTKPTKPSKSAKSTKSTKTAKPKPTDKINFT